jgi:hypothetical protein
VKKLFIAFSLVVAGLCAACLPTPIAVVVQPVVQAPAPNNLPIPGPLHVDGTEFRTADNKIWIYGGFTDFSLYNRYLNGENIDLILRERHDVGANIVRVFGMVDSFNHLRPQEHADYYDKLRPFADEIGRHGLYLEFVAFADAQIIMPSQADQLIHWNKVALAFVDTSNVLMQVVNQGDKNGVDSTVFPLLPWSGKSGVGGLLTSRDSGMEDTNPKLPVMSYSAYTSRRDLPKGMLAGQDLFWAINGYGAETPDGSGYAGTHQPTVTDENPGFGETEGKRWADPVRAYRLGVDEALWGNGGTFHCDDCILSNYLPAGQKADAIAFFNGLHSVTR